MLTTSEQIRIIAKRQGLTLTQIAAATGQTRQNLNNKLHRDTWTINELQRIAAAAGLELAITWTDKDGNPLF